MDEDSKDFNAVPVWGCTLGCIRMCDSQVSVGHECRNERPRRIRCLCEIVRSHRCVCVVVSATWLRVCVCVCVVTGRMSNMQHVVSDMRTLPTWKPLNILVILEYARVSLSPYQSSITPITAYTPKT